MEHRVWIAVFAFIGASAPALGEEIIVISPADCARIVRHVPAPDVAYQPGIDINGNAVAPADLDGGTSLDLNGEDVAIDIAVPLRAFEGTVDDETKFTDEGGKIDRFDADAKVGTVTVRGGDVYFNDKLISSRELELLAAACRKN